MSALPLFSADTLNPPAVSNGTALNTLQLVEGPPAPFTNSNRANNNLILRQTEFSEPDEEDVDDAEAGRAPSPSCLSQECPAICPAPIYLMQQVHFCTDTQQVNCVALHSHTSRPCGPRRDGAPAVPDEESERVDDEHMESVEESDDAV